MMKLFDLPRRMEFRRVVPKNAFDSFLTSKQRQLFTDQIKRITWTHKLSTETSNLISKEVQEIQLFKIELKQRLEIYKVMELMQKYIPYHIVCWVEYEGEGYLTTAAKHAHPTIANTSVLDWTFKGDWVNSQEASYAFKLHESLDYVFKDLCDQLSKVEGAKEQSLNLVIEQNQRQAQLLKEKERLEKAIKREKQFNKKVELNQRLKKVKSKISDI